MTQPRWVGDRVLGTFQVPRVAALPQPLAMGQNPVEIPATAKQLAEFWKLEKEAEKMLEGLAK